MMTIKSNTTSELIINKSRFITDLIYVDNPDNIDIHLNSIKNKYKGATHYCYAYIIDNIKRFNDDGEPNGTAGVPILNILEANNLNYVLCVVTRYFGGIKLGAGGLIRAYSNAAKTAVESTKLKKLIKGKQIKITFTYDNTKQIDYLLQNINIKDKIYDENITYVFNVGNDLYEQKHNELLPYTISIEILKETII